MQSPPTGPGPRRLGVRKTLVLYNTVHLSSSSSSSFLEVLWNAAISHYYQFIFPFRFRMLRTNVTCISRDGTMECHSFRYDHGMPLLLPYLSSGLVTATILPFTCCHYLFDTWRGRVIQDTGKASSGRDSSILQTIKTWLVKSKKCEKTCFQNGSLHLKHKWRIASAKEPLWMLISQNKLSDKGKECLWRNAKCSSHTTEEWHCLEWESWDCFIPCSYYPKLDKLVVEGLCGWREALISQDVTTDQ